MEMPLAGEADSFFLWLYMPGGGALQGRPDNTPDLGRYGMVWGRTRRDLDEVISWEWVGDLERGLLGLTDRDVWEPPYINFLRIEAVSDQATMRSRGENELALGKHSPVPLVQLLMACRRVV